MGLLRPLRARRDVLFVDLRGTGRSGPLDCRAFRRTVEDYRLRAARCARQLGPRRDFYGTHAAVDDVAAVLDALGIRQVDLYGDSYGTYAGQAFAVHHGDRLRSLVLDAAYPLPGTDPAYGDLAEATQRALRLVCERRPSCAARGEDPLGVVGRMLEAVRARPFTARGRDTDGRLVRVRVDEESFTGLVQSGYGNLPMYRDVLAAIRSFEAGDRAPLLRLMAENKLDPTPYPVRSFSEALYLAVTCHDYPQLWDPAAPLAQRRQQLAAELAGRPPEQFAPFRAAVWAGLEYEGATACLRWPGPRVADPVVPPGATYPAVPTLVLNGDLDNITASSGARVVASRFPRSTFVEVANSVHVTAVGDRDDCAAPIVRRFIRRLDAGDTSCAARIAEVRHGRRVPAPCGRGGAGRAARGRRKPPGGAACSGRRGGDGRGRDRALGDQLQRHVTRAARRPLELHGRPRRAVPLPRRTVRARRAGQRHRDVAARRRLGARAAAAAGPWAPGRALGYAAPAGDRDADGEARRPPAAS